MNKKQKPERPRDVGNDFVDVLQTITRKWTQVKKSEERQPAMVRYRSARMTSERRTSQTEAAAKVMEEAYLAASANGTLPATAKQVFYQARPKIMAMTDNRPLQSQYFTQALLPNYMTEHSCDWDIVFDARGHLEEPHTNFQIGLGTLEVRGYLNAMRKPEIAASRIRGARVNTSGPAGAFSGILFIEKEGFTPLFRHVSLAERHDLAIMSTKGVSVTAARHLVDRMCARYGIPLLVLHDFDIAGFMILGTLQRDTRRYEFQNSIDVIDLGLRLDDIEGLEREPAAESRTSTTKLREQLSNNGATEEEINILLTERVELNAMGSAELIELIERKLRDNGIGKVVPDRALLEEAYREFDRSIRLNEIFAKAEEEFGADEDAKVPANLGKKVREVLKKHDDLRWDDAVQVVLDGRRLDDVRKSKKEEKAKAGLGSGMREDDDDEEEGSS
jgi:hypothetical protein